MSKDNLGDRMKEYESAECSRKLTPLLPVLIRLDGKCFSRWTNDLQKPYDERLSSSMVEVTKFLVDKLQAKAGYTQSDEITLLLNSDEYDKEIEFGGKIHKLVSTSASMATAVFNDETAEFWPDKPLAFFDSRAWNVPSKEEATNAFLWRQNDATKNSISSAARCHFSHKELHRKKTSEMQEMLFSKGVNWNDYPDFFKRGTFVQRLKRSLPLDPHVIATLPDDHEAKHNPDLLVERYIVESLCINPLKNYSIQDRINFLFYGKELHAQ